MFGEELDALFDQARNDRQVGSNSSSQTVLIFFQTEEGILNFAKYRLRLWIFLTGSIPINYVTVVLILLMTSKIKVTAMITIIVIFFSYENFYQ